jgi:hypothetical protein
MLHHHLRHPSEDVYKIRHRRSVCLIGMKRTSPLPSWLGLNYYQRKWTWWGEMQPS